MDTTPPHTPGSMHRSRRRREQRHWPSLVALVSLLYSVHPIDAADTGITSIGDTIFGSIDSQYECLAGDDGRAGACNPWIKDRMCATGLVPPGQDKANRSGGTLENVIPIGYMRTLSGVDARSAPTDIYGMLCAIEQANKQLNFSNNATLDVYFTDTLGMPVGGTAGALCLHNLAVPLIVGPSFSGAAAAAATVSKIFNTPVIGTVASSPNLANSEEYDGYPTYTRVMASDAGQAAGLVKLVKTLGWRRIATFSLVNDEYGNGLLQAFEDSAGLELTVKRMWYRQYNYAGGRLDLELVDRALAEIKSAGFRVILLAGYGPDIEQILDRAKEAEMTGKGWAWLGSDSWVSFTLLRAMTDGSLLRTVGGTSRGLANDGITEVMGIGTLGLLPHVDTSSDTWQTLETCHESHINDTTGPFGNLSWVDTEPTWTASFMYDATYLAALGLHKLYDEENNSVYPPVPGEVLNRYFKSKLLNNLRTTSFIGATGNVSFTKDGERNSSVIYDVVNVLSDGIQVVGLFDAVANKLTMYDDVQIVFPGNVPEVPSDGVEECVFSAHLEYSTTLGSGFLVAGALLSIGCAYFNIRYRNNKIVRVSAWRVNLLTIFGCFLMFLAVFLFSLNASEIVSSCDGVGTKHSANFSNNSSSTTIENSVCMAPSEQCETDAGLLLCTTPLWLFGLSFTIAFGTLIAKMYRLTKLFSGHLVRRRITDVHVIGYVVGLVFPMVLLLLIWTTLFPMRMVIDAVPAGSLGSFNLRQYCAGPSFFEFQIILVFFCGLLLMLGSFFAWSVKDVWIKEVNDSRSVAMCIYTILVVGSCACMAGAVLEYGEAAFLVMFLCGWATTTITLLFLFVPKIYQVCCMDPGPNGNFTMLPMRHGRHGGGDGGNPHFAAPGQGGIHPLDQADQIIQGFESYRYSSEEDYTLGAEGEVSSGSYYDAKMKNKHRNVMEKNKNKNNKSYGNNNSSQSPLPTHQLRIRHRSVLNKSEPSTLRKVQGHTSNRQSGSISHSSTHNGFASIGDFNDEDFWTVTPMSSTSYSGKNYSIDESNEVLPTSHASVTNPIFRFAPPSLVLSWNGEDSDQALT